MDPITLDVPDQIETERLLLRVPKFGDGPIAFESARASLKELKEFMLWAKDDYAEQDAEIWCRKAAAQFLTREQFQFFMVHRETNRHIGHVGAFRFNWDIPKGEIGYWLRSDHTGKGYMTEAVNGLTKMLFEHLKFNRVEIRCDDLNARSGRVAERAGYKLDGILRCDSKGVDGSLSDTRVYSKIAGE